MSGIPVKKHWRKRRELDEKMKRKTGNDGGCMESTSLWVRVPYPQV